MKDEVKKCGLKIAALVVIWVIGAVMYGVWNQGVSPQISTTLALQTVNGGAIEHSVAIVNNQLSVVTLIYGAFAIAMTIIIGWNVFKTVSK